VKIREMTLSGVYEIQPQVYGDVRGSFAETYRRDLLEDVLGHRVDWVQGNTSVSRARTIRGIHYSLAPGGQAKYVTCTAGRVWDLVMDLRVGSPAFGAYTAVVLDAATFNAVYIPPGFGHGFVAMEEDTRVSYLVSSRYQPEYECGVTPVDPVQNIRWCGVIDPYLSDKDAQAPTISEAREAGRLPVYSATDGE
jgi:dTDP-4-dehydrorhamnose 3,5-epimerase